MSDFGTTPVSDSVLAANTFPVSAVYVPNTPSSNLTATEGGPSTTDDNSKASAPVSIYGKVGTLVDGADVAQGTTTQTKATDGTATSWSVIQLLKGIFDKLLNTLAVTQSGTWTVQPGNTANTTAWKVDGSAVTQPISGSVSVSNFPGTQPVSGTITANQGGTWNITNVSGTVSLPTGASTSAKQPALGTAGVASADVITVQGIASMTALKTDGSAVTQPVSGTFWQATQPVSGTVTANAGTNLNTSALALESGGNLASIKTDADSIATNTSNTATNTSNVNTATGTKTDSKATDGSTTAWSVIALLKGIIDKLLSTLAVTQSGTWTVQPGNTANTTAWKVDASGATVPVSGTFWQATQPVSGTITANIGTANGLALDASVTGLQVSQGSTTSGQKGELIQGAVTTNAPSYTTAQTSPVSLDTSGLLRTSLKDTPSNTNNLNVNIAASAATMTVSGTITANQGGSNWTTNTVQLNGTTIDTNSGVKSAGTQRVVLATDQPALTNALKVDGSAVTQPVSGTITANAGAGPFPVAGMVASGASNANNPVKVGGAFNTTQPTVTNGQVVDAQYSARGAAIVATGTDTFNVTVNAALPTGSNVIGHVIADSGSTTAVTQATASNLNAQVQGAAASGATQAGNPVKTGGVFNTTQPTVTNGQAVDAQMTARGAQIVATGTDTFNATINAALPTGSNTIGALSANQSVNVAQIGGVNTPLMTTDAVAQANFAEIGTGLLTFGNNVDRWRAVTNIGDNSGTGTASVGPALYNEANWDKQRNNTDNIAVFASAARTTTQTSADQTNYNARGLYLIVDVTAGSTPLLTPAINMKDPVSGKYRQIHANFTQINATGTFVYLLYPGIGTAAGNITAVNSVVLPRTWQMTITVGNSNSITYSVSCSYIL